MTLRNIARPLRASMSATSCGVVTTTAPVRPAFCVSVSCASPVPGGRSMTMKSSVAPLHVGEELIDRLHHHRAAPDHRRVGIGDEAEGHGLDAVALHRDDLLVVLVDLRAPLDAEHHLLRRAVDVGVEQADACSRGRGATRARFVETVDLPTPPFPEATAMRYFTPSSAFGCDGIGAAAGRCLSSRRSRG